MRAAPTQTGADLSPKRQLKTPLLITQMQGYSIKPRILFDDQLMAVAPSVTRPLYFRGQ